MTLQGRISLLSISFATAVALYFVGHSLHFEEQLVNDIVKTLPLSLLTIIAWCFSERKCAIMPLAFLFSALGDLAGEHRNFILQIGMFAVAHLLFTAHFLRRAKFDKVAYIGSLLIAVAATCLASTIILHIEHTAEQWACTLYIVIISIMAIAATTQQRYRWWYIIAATSFIFSDACIAWNRFVERIPHAGVIIMVSYFVAQYIFATTYIAERKDRSTK